MRQIGIKYHTEGEVYKYDGTLIPSDEPLILFRGRDRLIPQLLDYYLKLRREIKTPERNLPLLEADIHIINSWQQAHPDKLKTPE